MAKSTRHKQYKPRYSLTVIGKKVDWPTRLGEPESAMNFFRDGVDRYIRKYGVKPDKCYLGAEALDIFWSDFTMNPYVNTQSRPSKLGSSIFNTTINGIKVIRSKTAGMRFVGQRMSSACGWGF